MSTKWSGFSASDCVNCVTKMRIRNKIDILLIVGSGYVFTAVSAGAQEEGLRDIRGPVAYPLHPFYIVLLWLLMTAGVIVLFRMARRYAVYRKLVRPDKPPVPPWEVALDLLEKLKLKKYLEYDKYQQYYSELADILRRYMEEYFGIRAPEMTTEEFLESIRTNEMVAEEHRLILEKFMREADVVKFAKVSPTVKEAEQSLELAKRFIMQSYEDPEDEA